MIFLELGSNKKLNVREKCQKLHVYMYVCVGLGPVKSSKFREIGYIKTSQQILDLKERFFSKFFLQYVVVNIYKVIWESISWKNYF